MNCINCGTEVVGKYCPNCGQPSPPRKITLGHMYHDFQARIYGFDGMFPRTLKDITVRPGKAARSFIDGNRVQYYGPVGYFFLMITVLLLLVSLLDVDLTTFLKAGSKSNWAPQPKEGSGQAKFMEIVFQFISDNLKFVAFALIPLQGFVSRFLFFRKSKLNFLEHTVLPFYIQGHLYWMSILSVIYFKVTGSFFANWLTISMGLFYFSYAFSDFFGYQSKVKAFFKGLGVYLVSQVLLMMMAAIIMAVIFKVNPELMKLVRPSNNP